MSLKKKASENILRKEKMLVTSLFSFTQNVFYSFHNKFQSLVAFIVICTYF